MTEVPPELPVRRIVPEAFPTISEVASYTKKLPVIEKPINTIKAPVPLADYSVEDVKKFQIQAESSGNTKALSPKGARGLMQLLPATAKEEAEKQGLPWKGTKALHSDPEYNIQLGTGYLNRLKERFGDMRLALAAYNWGPGKLVSLMEKKKTEDFNKLFNHLPDETKKYVSNIINGVNKQQNETE